MKKTLFYIIAFILLGVWTLDGSATYKKEKWSVYIDPLFGGKESGLIIAQKNPAKTLTLSMGQKIKTQLEKKGIVSYLSREKDLFIPLDERRSQARKKTVDAYLAITVSHSVKDCVNISYPKLEEDTIKKKEEDLDSIIRGSVKEIIVRDSTILAQSIMAELKNRAISTCIDKQPQKYYIIDMDNAFTPTVVIDFGILNANSNTVYILNQTTIEKILEAISEGIEKYFTSKKGDKGTIP